MITLLLWPLAIALVALDRLAGLADLALLALRRRKRAPLALPPAPEPVREAEAPVDYASLLEVLTVRDLRKTCVVLGLPRDTYRSARKADLVALLADLHVNPTL